MRTKYGIPNPTNSALTVPKSELTGDNLIKSLREGYQSTIAPQLAAKPTEEPKTGLFSGEPLTPATASAEKPKVTEPLKLLPNAISDAWNLIKQMTYGTAKTIKEIPGVAADIYGEEKKSGRGIGGMISDIGKSVLPAVGQTAWGIVPQSAKELLNTEAMGQIPKEFEALAKQTGGYGNAIKAMIKEIPSSTPKALKDYMGQVDKARMAFENHPLNETIGYMMLKDVASMTPEKLSKQTEYTKQSFKDVFGDISKGKVIPKEVSDAAISLKSKLGNKALESTSNDWNEVFGQTKSGVKRLAKSEMTGKNPAQFLSEKGLSPKVEGGKINPDEAITQVKESMKPLNDITEKVLQTNPTKVSLDDLEADALKSINTKLNKGNPDYIKMQNGVKEEINNYRQTYGDSVSLDELNDIKIGQRESSRVFDATKPKFQSNVNYQISNVAKETIEKTFGNELNIKELNKTVGDHLDALDQLEKVRGQAVKGGRIGRMIGTATGVVLGHTIPGKVIGGLAGNYVVEALQDLSISNPVKSMLLKYAEVEDPAIYQQAVDYLSKNGINLNTEGGFSNPTVGKTAPEPISPDLQPLAQEAPDLVKQIQSGKYKSAEELAKNTYYHATTPQNAESIMSSGFKTVRGDLTSKVNASAPDGVFLYRGDNMIYGSDGLDNAREFGKNFKESKIIATEINGKVLNTTKAPSEITGELVNSAKSRGYVAIKGEEQGVPFTFVFDKTAIKPIGDVTNFKNVTDFYNQAVGKEISTAGIKISDVEKTINQSVLKEHGGISDIVNDVHPDEFIIYMKDGKTFTGVKIPKPQEMTSGRFVQSDILTFNKMREVPGLQQLTQYPNGKWYWHGSGVPQELKGKIFETKELATKANQVVKGKK